MGALKNKKTFLREDKRNELIPIAHMGVAQKKQLEAGAVKLAYASYDEVKEILDKFQIVPQDKEKYLFIFVEPEKPLAKPRKGSLKEELQNLGFKVSAKEEALKLYFKMPLSLKGQKKALKEIQAILGVTQNEIAAIIGCSPRKIWEVLNEEEGCFKQKSHINNFNQLLKLMNQVLGIFKKEYVAEWFKSGQKDLKNKTPLNLLMTGHIDLLFQWAYMQLEGSYN